MEDEDEKIEVGYCVEIAIGNNNQKVVNLVTVCPIDLSTREYLGLLNQFVQDKQAEGDNFLESESSLPIN